MKYNKILFVTIFLLAITFSFKQVDALTFTNPATVEGYPGETITLSFNIDNTDGNSTTLTFLTQNLAKTTDSTKIITKPTIATKIISANITDTVQFSLAIPSTSFGDYTGKITPVNEAGANLTELTYTARVLFKAAMTTSQGSIIFPTQNGLDKATSLTVSNTGSVPLDIIMSLTGIFNDTTNNQIIIKFDSQSSPLSFSLNEGASRTVNIDVDVPSDQKTATYTGTISLSTNQNINSAIPFNIVLEQDICSKGRRNDKQDISSISLSHLKIDIDKPDSGDDLHPGEEIEINVNIENTGGDDKDIAIEAILYDLDKNNEIESVETDSVTINEGDDKDLKAVIKFPTDEDLDESNDFVIFIKAFEDGNEDENCNFDSVDVDFKRRTRDAIINKFLIEPSKAVCSTNARFTVDVESVGTKEDEGVQVKVLKSDIGLEAVSDIFTLSEFDETNNLIRKTFSYLIPSTVKDGIYSIEAIVFYDNGKKSRSEFKSLEVKCTGVSSDQTGQGSMTLLQSSFSATQGRQISVPVKITNPTNSALTYTVEFVPTGNWADSTSQQQTINSAQESTIFIYPPIKTTAQLGTVTGTVNLKQGNNILSTATASVNIQQAQSITDTGTTGGAVFQSSNTFDSFARNWIENGRIFWVLGIIELLLLIILFIRLLFRK